MSKDASNNVGLSNDKPTIYLDHNVLDLFVKKEFTSFNLDSPFANLLRNDLQAVYSDETLREIRISVGYESEFINVLSSLKACYLKPTLEMPGFVSTDKATLNFGSPQEYFDSYVTDNDTSMEDSMMKFALKLNGGLKGESIESIHEEQKIAFDKLFSDIDLEEFPEDIQLAFKSIFSGFKNQYSQALEKTENIINKDVPDTKNWNGIKDFREGTKTGPKYLNNINPPRVVNKVFEAFRKENSDMVGIDKIFDIDVNPIYPTRKSFTHEKVFRLYNLLNSFGYCPDSKLHNEKRFRAASSDNNHASLASFCDHLCSADENFLKKTEAAYEYLGVRTNIIDISSTIKQMRHEQKESTREDK